MNDVKEIKEFDYQELLAMCLLCAAHATLIIVDKKFKDEKEGRKMIEDECMRVIDIRWNHPNKKKIGETV